MERIGGRHKCTVCGRTKKPVGRFAPREMANGLCDQDCPGFWEDPKPTDLWAGEKRSDFGYPVGWEDMIDE